MSIQSSFNQSLSIAGLLFTQHPEVKAASEQRAQVRSEEREIGKLQKQKEILHADYISRKPEITEKDADKQASPEHLKEGASMLSERAALQQGIADRAQRIFQLNPTEQSYQEYQKASRAQESLGKLEKLFLKEAAAKEALLSGQEERRLGRPSILNEPTNYGLTVGQLGPKAQAYIQAQLAKEGRNG